MSGGGAASWQAQYDAGFWRRAGSPWADKHCDKCGSSVAAAEPPLYTWAARGTPPAASDSVLCGACHAGIAPGRKRRRFQGLE